VYVHIFVISKEIRRAEHKYSFGIINLPKVPDGVHFTAATMLTAVLST
jgi:hypothetical protein